MEEKFSFHAADEIADVWTGIWADMSQIAASLPENGGSFKRLGMNSLIHIIKILCSLF